ncbi:MAG: VWA domain-containing protein [Alphaproteobacteria bacterium]
MSLARLFLAVFFLSACLTFTPAAHADTNVLFIVDASGSMKKPVDGKQRMIVAKKVLGETLSNMPKDAHLGLFLYGHRKAKDCSDMELVAPIGGEDAAAISKKISGLTPKGETPIADSLRQAAKSFNAFKGQQNSIILVTDGIEECKGDPCAAAQELKDAGLDVKVNIVGFTLSEQEGQALKCVADITGGQYYSASNAAGLTDALKQVQQQVQETAVVQTAKPVEKTDDLLAAKNGGTLIFGPNDNWATMNTEKLKTATYAGEGVWQFKDGKPGTFDRVELLIPDASEYNLKDFEVLAGDESPTGLFRSLGEFTTMNAKVQPEGWQAFKFEPTTAKYLKIVFKKAHSDSYVRGHRIRVPGKLDETATAAAKPAQDGIDLLSTKNGGTLVMAPNNKWETINTEAFSGPTYSGDGVWSFKDGKPATFSSIEVQIPDASEYNLKDFEVFAGNEGPSGQFLSLGVFTTQNTKVMPDGWQAFTFAPTTAKYVKVSFKAAHSTSYIRGHRMRLFGKIDDAAPAAEKAPEIAGKNILQQSNGGMLLVSPNDEWTKLNDGKGDRATTYNGQGIWAFKGEKPATFEAIDVLVPHTDSYNLKEFEVLVGDDGPTGTFRSIGTFTAENIKVMPNGNQRFTFPKVTAKYIKFDFKTGWGSYIAAYELGVIGTVEE